jgi:hypothetical protein
MLCVGGPTGEVVGQHLSFSHRRMVRPSRRPRRRESQLGSGAECVSGSGGAYAGTSDVS